MYHTWIKVSANMSGIIVSFLLDCLESQTRQKLAGMMVRLVLFVFIIWMITNAFKALFNVCLCVCVCRRVWSGWAGWTAAPRPRCVKASR